MRSKIKKIIEFLNNTEGTNQIKEKFLLLHPADLGMIFPKLDYNHREKIYSSLNERELASFFVYLDDPIEFLQELDSIKASKILENMEIDDARTILNKVFDLNLKQTYINNLSKSKQNDLEYISKIKEDRIGSIITTNYISVDAAMDVKEAMKKLIDEADVVEFIDTIFVTKNNEYIGTISLNDLIVARSPILIDEIMDNHPISIDINDSITNATKIISNYGLSALGVVDNNNLVGIITSDDAFEILADVLDTQYANLAGVTTENISDQRFFKRLFERLPWLLILLALSLVTTNVMGAFEGVIKQVSILIFFQTLIFAMAGNVGTQSLAVTIQRIIRNDKFSAKDIKKHITKEIKINLVNSFLLMILAFVVCYIFISLYDQSSSAFLIALVISLSIGITILFSAFLGSLLPIILSKSKINPAVASGPLITNINDIFSIIIYFSLAALLFRITF